MPFLGSMTIPTPLLWAIRIDDVHDLQWSVSHQRVQGWRIERKVNAGAWSTIATKDPSDRSHTDEDVAVNGTYLYRVVAFRGSREATSDQKQIDVGELSSELLAEDDLAYLGAFRLPVGSVGTYGPSQFEAATAAIAYNAANDSLFIVGQRELQSIAEVSIPSPLTGAISGLNTASVLQGFTGDVRSQISNYLAAYESYALTGGLAVIDGNLVGTLYEYYDADGDAMLSHYVHSGLTLNNANFGNLRQVGTLGNGYVGGYICPIPLEWQDDFEVPYLTGTFGISIMSRSSAGPCAVGFNPADLGVVAAPTESMSHYPFWGGGGSPDDHPVAPPDTTNNVFNGTTKGAGCVFAAGTDTVLFFGSHGIGAYWYGSNGEYPGFEDPARTNQGNHAYPYVWRIWAYDANDLLAVKNGTMDPWEPQPYGVWDIDLPYENPGKDLYPGEVAYDPSTKRIFWVEPFIDSVGSDYKPIVHVFQHP